MLPLDKAVKVGNGKNIVIEFTDPDCVYCRKIEEFFSTRNDITRYVFFFPLEQIHPQAKAKSKEILCSQDPAAAYKSAMEGALDKAELKGCGGRDKEIDDVLALHVASALKMGVSGTPAMWVNKKQVSGADAKKLERYLSEGPSGSGVADGVTVK
jgi:thiol:disulfide interchange protein DsbC